MSRTVKEVHIQRRMVKDITEYDHFAVWYNYQRKNGLFHKFPIYRPFKSGQQYRASVTYLGLLVYTYHCLWAYSVYAGGGGGSGVIFSGKQNFITCMYSV